MGNKKAVLLIVCVIVAWNVVGLVILAVWRVFEPTSRLADQTLAVAILMGVCGGATLVPLFRARRGAWPNGLLAGLAGVTCGLVFLQGIASVAINVDRSRSLFVLLWISQLEPSQPDAIVEQVSCEFGAQDEAGLRQRIAEHEQRGLVAASTEGVQLTSVGQLIVGTANLTAKVLNLKGWDDADLRPMLKGECLQP